MFAKNKQQILEESRNYSFSDNIKIEGDLQEGENENKDISSSYPSYKAFREKNNRKIISLVKYYLKKIMEEFIKFKSSVSSVRKRKYSNSFEKDGDDLSDAGSEWSGQFLIERGKEIGISDSDYEINELGIKTPKKYLHYSRKNKLQHLSRVKSNKHLKKLNSSLVIVKNLLGVVSSNPELSSLISSFIANTLTNTSFQQTVSSLPSSSSFSSSSSSSVSSSFSSSTFQAIADFFRNNPDLIHTFSLERLFPGLLSSFTSSQGFEPHRRPQTSFSKYRPALRNLPEISIDGEHDDDGVIIISNDKRHARSLSPSQLNFRKHRKDRKS
jgi:hypothetical protein